MEAQLSDVAARNTRHIARFAAKPYPAPLPATSVTVGFEACAYLKMVRELRHEDARIRRKAVLAARELLVAPQKLVQCVATGITPALIALLQASARPEPEDTLRRDAAATLQLLLRRELGVRDLLQHGGLQPLLGLVAAGSPPPVRDEAYAALQEASRFECGRAAMAAQKGSLAALVARAQQEDPGRAALALTVLYSCTQVRDSDTVLGQIIYNASGVPALAELLRADRQPPVVRREAARLLGALCSTRHEAITQAVANGCVARLVRELEMGQGGNVDSAVAAASALTYITMAKEGKVDFCKAGGVRALEGLLVSSHVSGGPASGDGGGPQRGSLPCLLLHITASVAELPECRKQLLEGRGAEAIRRLAAAVQQGQQQQEGEPADGAAVAAARAAGDALRALGFKHWPQ